MNLGVALSDLGQFDEAIEWLESSLRLHPQSPEALDNVGMTLSRQGKWDEAMVWYDRALAVRPDFPEAHRNRSFIWLTHGDFGEDGRSMSGGWVVAITGSDPCRAPHGPAGTSQGARSCCGPNRDSATSCNSSDSPARSGAAGPA